jgi:phosphoglycolate phosphatase-like HAD superfamily hydrolase
MTCETVKQVLALLNASQIVFWDFDGVIKDSVMVKSAGYEKLFLPFGEDVVKRVNKHHNVHGGISRYEKIPLYLSWAGEPANPIQVQDFCDRFSELVQQAVVDSPWVPGVCEYLSSHYADQCFVLITGTPQKEIEEILHTLNITRYFRNVYGAPKAKTIMVKDVLERLSCPFEQALVIGDSGTDLEAAKNNNVAFLLRRTSLNKELQKQFTGPSFENLNL